MKLRNKNGVQIAKYNSLTELNEEWEDYEEPKENGFDNIITLVESYSSKESERYPKEIVDKLKAWKRLKDKGVYFVRDAVNKGIYAHNFVLRPMMDKDKRYVSIDVAKEIYNDIKLIFELNVKDVKNEKLN